jgi:bifunctional polynucleotide phosphatase/kinase
MPPIVWKLHSARRRKKIAAFDYDWTLVRPKSGGTFPKDVHDWQWLFPSVPETLRALYDKGFMIVIFTNQSKTWKQDQIRTVLEPLNIPMFIGIAVHKEDYKPNRLMFDTILQTHRWDPRSSFFVGDALGRKGDWSNSDLMFANAVGLHSKAPEEFFSSVRQQPVPIPKDPEIVIMVGYPGSGKTTFATSLVSEKDTYKIIHGDTYKTSKKMIQVAEDYLKTHPNHSIVFDATHPSRAKRAEYIEFAKRLNYSVRCIHVTTSLEDAYARNMQRPADKQIPRIVYYKYRKAFEEPMRDEGCDVIKA